MSYTSEEYKKMRFRVMDFESELYTNLPEISIYKEFRDLYSIKSLKFDFVFRYIALIHDINSPLHNESDLKKRKVEAAQISKFPKDKNDTFLKPYMEIIQNKGDFSVIVNKAVIRYARLQNDQNFVLLCAYDETILNNSSELLGITDQTVQKNLLANMKSLGIMITDLRKEFLKDTSDALYQELLEEIANHNLELTPEQLILKEDVRKRVLQQGNPYQDYEKEWFGLSDLSNAEFLVLYKEMTNDTEEAKEFFKSIGLEHEGAIATQKAQEQFKKSFAKHIKKRKLEL